jgi:hypothetical protein
MTKANEIISEYIGDDRFANVVQYADGKYYVHMMHKSLEIHQFNHLSEAEEFAEDWVEGM